MFYPIINRHTPLTLYSATLIDKIFTNCFAQNVCSKIILNDISDHLPIFAIFSSELVNTKISRDILIRDFNQMNQDNFQTCLSQIDWHNDPNILFNTFLSKYSKPFETCFPFKTIKGNNFNKIRTPWISKGLLVSIRKKNRLYKKFINNPNQVHNDLLNHLIRIAKKNYYDERLRNAKNNIKVSWKLIQEVLYKKTKHNLSSTFKVDGKKITDKIEIADKFYKYFTNIGPNLVSEIPLTDFSFCMSLGSRTNESIWQKPTSIAKLEQVCTSFKKSTASCFDDIPIFIIKNSFVYISEALVHIINLSFIKGISPDQLKTAKLIPIYKMDDHELLFNYRPISLLSNFSKIFER